MKPERAAELSAEMNRVFDRAGCLNYDGPPVPEPMTEAENQEVRKTWKSLPGYYSMYDTLRYIAAGLNK